MLDRAVNRFDHQQPLVNTFNAGGTAYEARAYFSPGQGATQADNDRMVSPGFNTTGLSSIHLSFRQMLDDYVLGDPDVWIKVQSSSDKVNWTDEWVYAGAGVDGGSIPAEVKTMDITNNLGGTTYIAWTLSGYTYDINYWYVDDICIDETVPCTTNTWTGAASNAWDNPGNWSCGVLPDATMSVIVPSGLTTYPEIPVGVTADCFDISVETGANISVFGTLNVVNP
jgi:hypothetical protein